jgi:hypothetical protein
MGGASGKGIAQMKVDGLPRRFAPRNDNKVGAAGSRPPLWEPSATTSQVPTETSRASKFPSLQGPKARGNPHTASAGTPFFLGLPTIEQIERELANDLFTEDNI